MPTAFVRPVPLPRSPRWDTTGQCPAMSHPAPRSGEVMHLALRHYYPEKIQQLLPREIAAENNQAFCSNSHFTEGKIAQFAWTRLVIWRSVSIRCWCYCLFVIECLLCPHNVRMTS